MNVELPTLNPRSVVTVPYAYTESGLDEVFLADGFEIDEHDGEIYVSIDDADALWWVIARTIATQPCALLPRDIRYLRRHLELTQAELSRRLCVDPQTVARWEKGQTEMPGSAEILLRLLVLSRDAEAAPVRVGNDLSSLIDQLSLRSAHQRSTLVFARGEGGWALQPARG